MHATIVIERTWQSLWGEGGCRDQFKAIQQELKPFLKALNSNIKGIVPRLVAKPCWFKA
jgi:hypothetical protein